MKKTSTYQDSNIRENAWPIGEEPEKCVKALDVATEEFIWNLENIERRCSIGGENQDEMLVLTTKAVMDMCNAAEKFEKNVGHDKSMIREAGIRLREKTSGIFSKSYFSRARTWPQGYPGDYKMIEFLYRNTPTSGGAGFHLDRYFLATTLTVAVRERKETLRDLLNAELDKRTEPKILDIACGSCRELFELAPEIKKSGAGIICVDFDSDALNFSAQRLSYTELPPERLKFRKYNALKMVSHERNLKEFGMQDIIYSVGFFDYLDDDVLIRLLDSLYKLLASGGSLIVSFKDCRRYRTFDTSWLLDWDAFRQRTEEDMWNLLERAEIPRAKITTTREKSGVIVFFTATK